VLEPKESNRHAKEVLLLTTKRCCYIAGCNRGPMATDYDTFIENHFIQLDVLEHSALRSDAAGDNVATSTRVLLKHLTMKSS
jgi:hypothetical protein